MPESKIKMAKNLVRKHAKNKSLVRKLKTIRLEDSHTDATSKKLSNIFLKNFGSKNGVDLKLPKRKPHKPINLLEDDV